MQFQEIQEASQVVEENFSNTALELRNKMAESSVTKHVPPEEEDNTEANGSQLLTEEEIDEFIMREQIAASEGNNAEIDSKYTP
jgi:hypothetical protein